MFSKSMILLVILYLEIVLLVTAESERRRYCGTELTDRLSVFCRKRYASRTVTVKRSGDGDDDYVTDESLDDSSPYTYRIMPFLANFDSSTALRPRMRREFWYQGGVADECCRRPCTKEQMMRYCGD